MSGFVKRYFISHNGSLGVQAIYGPEDIFPLTMVYKTLFDQDIYQGPEVYYYEAMTDIYIITVDAATLKRETTINPDLYRPLLQSAGNRLHSNIQFLENLRLHGAYCKTAHQLAYFGRQFGENTPAGVKIKLPLKHQDIADIIGTTRETVTASIIKLRSKKLITTNGKFLILDYDQLIEEAYS
jgi:CRP/FNR family transcriptional regulator